MTRLLHKIIASCAFSPKWAVAWLALVYVSLCGICDVPGSTVLPYALWFRWVLVVFACCMKASAIVLALRLCRRCKAMYAASIGAVAVYAMLSVINGATYGLYNMGITIKLMTVLSQTNGDEVQEFMPLLISNIAAVLSSPRTYAIAAIAGLSLAGAAKLSGRVSGISAAVLSLTGLVVLAAALYPVKSGRINFSVIGRTFKCVCKTYNERKQIERYMSSVSPLPHPESVRSRRLADVYMIVGESVSRAHLSIYGYPLATSPALGEIDEGLIVFDDAIGSSTTTAFNVSRILTFLSDRDDAAAWGESPMLFGLLKKAGYYTAWISNQERSGIWENPTVALVSDADYIKYVGSLSSDDATLMRYDEAVLPEVAQMAELEAGPKFVGVHLMGSHSLYRKRYPDSYGIFNADSVLGIKRDFALSRPHAATIAEYDNSIRYTDHIIARILNHVTSSPRPTVMIYFSDHGENVYDDSDDFMGRDPKYVEVPFVIYANSSFREHNGELYERLVNAASRPFSTANIAHLICTLTGTEYQYYNAELDVASPHYAPAPRYVDDAVWASDRSR